MIETTKYSQKDWRWAYRWIGFSHYSFKSIGCTVVSLTNLLNACGYKLTPPQVNDELKKVQGFAPDRTGQKCLLIWSKVPLAFPLMKWVWRGYNYDNERVKTYVYGKKIPVMVEVLHPSGFRHWVLYCGDRKLIDPLGGVVRSTAFYKPTGFSLFDCTKL